MVYLVSILIYLLILAGIGIFFAARVKKREDFSVAGRTLSPWVMALTMLACWIGTGSIIGNAQKTFDTGIAAIVLPLGGFIGMILLSLIARRARSIDATSVPDIIGQRFGKAASLLAMVSLVAAYLVIVSYQFNAGGEVLRVISENSLDKVPDTIHDFVVDDKGMLKRSTATIFAAVVIITFASLAGLMSLAYQDVVTGIIITAMIVVSCVAYYFQAGGLDGIEAGYLAQKGGEEHLKFWGIYSPIQIINYLLPPMLLVLGDANQYQRIFASRNVQGAGLAVSMLIALSLLVELTIIITAWIAGSQINDPNASSYILIQAARDFLWWPLGCLFMITVVGIIMSTANSFLLVPSTSFLKELIDLYPKSAFSRGLQSLNEVWLSRAVIVLFGVASLFVSFQFAASTTFFDKALYAFTIYGASITPSLVAAIVWKRATRLGCQVSILSGIVITLVWSESVARLKVMAADDASSALANSSIWKVVSEMDAIIPASICSIGGLIIFSLLTKPTAHTFNTESSSNDA